MAHLSLHQPHKVFTKRFQTLSSQYAEESVSSSFTVKNNLWGMGTGTGQQTTQTDSADDNSVAWQTTYSWSGGDTEVKSYASVLVQAGTTNSPLSSLSSIPTSWDWTYKQQSADLTADVAYDIWLTKSTTGCTFATECSSFEVMVWLSAVGGARPAGDEIKKVTIGGTSWTLYKGPVQTWTVYSFVASQDIPSYKGDLMDFLNHLTTEEGVDDGEILNSVQAGTEPFKGSASLQTTAFTCSIGSGGSSSGGSTSGTGGDTSGAGGHGSSSNSTTEGSPSIPPPSSTGGSSDGPPGGTSTTTYSTPQGIPSVPPSPAGGNSAVDGGATNSTTNTPPPAGDSFGGSSGGTSTTNNPPQGTPSTLSTPTPSGTNGANSTSNGNELPQATGASGSCGARRCATFWSQCGGQDYTGPTCCVSGSTCVKLSSWWSHCKPDHGGGWRREKKRDLLPASKYLKTY
ncbi:concanavalin A-like lectin/glucanase [Meredithblackwellia eburnea MCA 4105]